MYVFLLPEKCVKMPELFQVSRTLQFLGSQVAGSNLDYLKVRVHKFDLNDNVPKLFDIIAENSIVSIFLFPIIIIFLFL